MGGGLQVQGLLLTQPCVETRDLQEAKALLEESA